MKRTVREIKKESEKRGIKEMKREEIPLWGILFVIEDFLENK